MNYTQAELCLVHDPYWASLIATYSNTILFDEAVWKVLIANDSLPYPPLPYERTRIGWLTQQTWRLLREVGKAASIRMREGTPGNKTAMWLAWVAEGRDPAIKLDPTASYTVGEGLRCYKAGVDAWQVLRS